MSALITGGAGFIGSHLTESLAENEDVIVFDDLSTGRQDNLKECLESQAANLINGSVLDRQALVPLIRNADTVYHLAAVVGVDRVARDPERTLAVNIDGTRNIIELCGRYDTKLVLASTSEVYGKNQDVPLSEEDDTIIGPTSISRWAYAVSKLADEHLALAGVGDIPVTVVRYFNCYGPKIDPEGYASVIAVFIDQALNGNPLTIYGDGCQTRSFTYVADTVAGTIAAGNYETGGVFNIGKPDEIAINDLAKLVLELTNSASQIVYRPYPSGWGRFEETKRRVPDIERAKQVLGFAPETELVEGLKKTIKWIRENPSTTFKGEVA